MEGCILNFIYFLLKEVSMPKGIGYGGMSKPKPKKKTKQAPKPKKSSPRRKGY